MVAPARGGTSAACSRGCRSCWTRLLQSGQTQLLRCDLPSRRCGLMSGTSPSGDLQICVVSEQLGCWRQHHASSSTRAWLCSNPVRQGFRRDQEPDKPNLNNQSLLSAVQALDLPFALLLIDSSRPVPDNQHAQRSSSASQARPSVCLPNSSMHRSGQATAESESHDLLTTPGSFSWTTPILLTV